MLRNCALLCACAVVDVDCRLSFAVVVQFLSPVWLSATPWTAARQAFLSFTITRSLLKLMSIELVMPSNLLILCHSLLLLPSIFPSIRVFSNELAFCIRWPKNGSFSISPFDEYLGFISFRIDWFYLLRPRNSQHHNSNASVFQRSAFFMIQLSHSYLTTGKTIALTSWAFVGKVMSLLFNTLYKFVIACLPRNKRLLVSWLQSPSAEILVPKKIQSVTVSIVSPSICHEWHWMPWS